MFQVIENRTGYVVSICKTIKGARRIVDRKDREYGAYGYSIRVAETGKAAI